MLEVLVNIDDLVVVVVWSQRTEMTDPIDIFCNCSAKTLRSTFDKV